ncbi:hypothetical protein HELRODRAFT_171404 [Helobdella robusta]|uniref:Globin domain-containing protein n=1 Tax=Helobdella robusta TaxID=6412 RepID=T1F484_HELRO|nr:hypothetical protein HELRODRAFT_171404 [Helobdella robusta]ESO05737.1 hypothetical protein HELRODRAFT_171404 [Helobdella robusta]
MGCQQSTSKSLEVDYSKEDWFAFLVRTQNMGANGFKKVKSEPLLNNLNYLNNDDVLTIREKQLVRESWTLLSIKLKSLGKQVFLRIFELRPSTKNLFPFKTVWGDKLIKHPLFLTHSKRFVKVIGCVVDRLDYLQEECAQPLIELGKKHVSIEGFLPDYYDVYIRAIISIWKQELKDVYTNELSEAWHKVLVYIVSKLKEGYETEWKVATYFNPQ